MKDPALPTPPPSPPQASRRARRDLERLLRMQPERRRNVAAARRDRRAGKRGQR